MIGIQNKTAASLTFPVSIALTGEPEKHHQKQCQAIQRAFLEHLNTTRNIVLHPKTVSHLYRPRTQTASRLDLRSLNKVITIDTKNQIAHVQGMTTFHDLVKETLKHGLRPKVVPELNKITVGGAIAGLAVESSSFKQGLFHETVTEIDVLTGEGKILTCSREQNAELFYGLPNSFGTLGYILGAKVELVPAKPFVELSYVKYVDLDIFFSALELACMDHDQYDFIDGAIFSEKEMVLVLGKATDTHLAPCSDYVRNGIYYKAIQNKPKDFMTIEDYIWRWDHDSFWSTENTILQNSLIRKTLGPYLLRSDRLKQLKDWIDTFQAYFIKPFTPKKLPTEEVIQDVGVPIDQCANFCRWLGKNIGIYPLFICPIKPPSTSTPLWKLPEKDKLHCDIGFFQAQPTPSGGLHNRMVENKLLEIQGRKSLYSRTHYSEVTFKQLYYGEGAYQHLKDLYDPYARFPTLFEKCVKGK